MTNITIFAVLLFPKTAVIMIIKRPAATKLIPPSLCVFLHTSSDDKVHGVRIH